MAEQSLRTRLMHHDATRRIARFRMHDDRELEGWQRPYGRLGELRLAENRECQCHSLFLFPQHANQPSPDYRKHFAVDGYLPASVNRLQP